MIYYLPTTQIITVPIKSCTVPHMFSMNLISPDHESTVECDGRCPTRSLVPDVLQTLRANQLRHPAALYVLKFST